MRFTKIFIFDSNGNKIDLVRVVKFRGWHYAYWYFKHSCNPEHLGALFGTEKCFIHKPSVEFFIKLGYKKVIPQKTKPSFLLRLKMKFFRRTSDNGRGIVTRELKKNYGIF